MALLMKNRNQLGVPEQSGSEVSRTSQVPGAGDVPDLESMLEETGTEPIEIETPEESETEEAQGLRGWWSRRKESKKLEGDFESYPHLLALKPKERYLFRSDYFEVDSSVACVLALFHKEAAQDAFAPFWGIDRIPDGLDDSVTVVVLEQVKKMDDKWVDSYTKQSEKLDRLDDAEQAESGTTSTRRKAAKVSADLEMIVSEIQNGASYLSVHNRLLVKAPDLETLEDSLDRITRLYIDRFGTISTAAYHGEQRQELSALFKNNAKKRGKGFHFTSTELAGSYSLVTNGLNDPGGEYVGYMVGDVNNSAVLMDVNAYDQHVVVADSSLSTYLGRERIANMWCSKISQACLLNNGKVVHLVLDGADLDKLGPKFEALTSKVDLTSGDVNMFEMFGEQSEELAIYSSHMEKLKLMFEQLYDDSEGSVRAIIRSTLEDIVTDFYVEQGMWRHNAKEQRHRLRVVGIPHTQVPRLQMFKSYLETAHKAELNAISTDQDRLRALGVIKGITQTMLSTNGDLFNNHTVDAIDGVRNSPRVIYNFSALRRRGQGVAMAQLVNIVGFAVGTLGAGDTVIIHGTEHIDDRVKAYLSGQFAALNHRGGRVVYSYDDVDEMLKDSDFNKFDAADYTLLGWMRDKTVAEYQKQLHQQIPGDLAGLIKAKGENLTYLRRGVSNVVFHLDLALGINPHREAQRRKIRQESERAAQQALMNKLLEADPVAGAHLTTARSDENLNGANGASMSKKTRRKAAKGDPAKEAEPGQAPRRRKLAVR